MRIIRFQHDDHISYGSIEHKNVCVWSKAPWLGGIATNQLIPLAEVKLMAPCEPRKIIATAINYPGATGLSEKMDEPLVFFKPSTSVIGPNDPIISPMSGLKVWGESELGLVIHQTLKNAKYDDVKKGVFGYTVGNDVSADNVLDWDHHLARSKGMDTFCVLGPWIDTEFKPGKQKIKGFHNGVLLREGCVNERLFQEPELLIWLSSWITLEPGDVILTGAPTRVRDREYLSHGDYFKCEIEGLGEIKNSFLDVNE